MYMNYVRLELIGKRKYGCEYQFAGKDMSLIFL
jgi:hypothetical protein